jgi:hypothetical protein
MYSHWEELPEEQWGDLLEAVDPDWIDNFDLPANGLGWYWEYQREEVLSALAEYPYEYGQDNDAWHKAMGAVVFLAVVALFFAVRHAASL